MNDPSIKRVFAKTARIDAFSGQVEIDGVRFPFWLDADGPTVERHPIGAPIHIVHLPILVEGVIEIIGDGGIPHIIDPVLGDVGEWARQYVREQFRAAYPDLEV